MARKTIVIDKAVVMRELYKQQKETKLLFWWQTFYFIVLFVLFGCIILLISFR